MTGKRNNRFYRGEAMKTKAPKSEAQKVREFVEEFTGEKQDHPDYSFRLLNGTFVMLRVPNHENEGALVVTESHIGHGLSIGTAKRLLAELKKALNPKDDE